MAEYVDGGLGLFEDDVADERLVDAVLWFHVKEQAPP